MQADIVTLNRESAKKISDWYGVLCGGLSAQPMLAASLNIGHIKKQMAELKQAALEG